ATGPLPLATLGDVEFHAIDDQAIPRLGNLGGAIVGLTVKAGEDGTVAVATMACAPAPELRFDNGVVAARIGVYAADESAADGGEVTGCKPFRDMLRETAPHEVVDTHLRLEIEADRRRLLRMEDRALAREQPDRSERTVIARGIRVRQRLENHLRADHHAVAAGVGRTGVLVRIVPEVDDELAIGNGDLDVVDTPVVLLLGELEGAVRQLAELGERDLFAEVHEGLHGALESLDAVFLRHFRKPLCPDAHGGDRRPYVTLEKVRHAR